MPSRDHSCIRSAPPPPRAALLSQILWFIWSLPKPTDLISKTKWQFHFCLIHDVWLILVPFMAHPLCALQNDSFSSFESAPVAFCWCEIKADNSDKPPIQKRNNKCVCPFSLRVSFRIAWRKKVSLGSCVSLFLEPKHELWLLSGPVYLPLSKCNHYY